jgi:RimJ/RimL family protein N-acetyltransferase
MIPAFKTERLTLRCFQPTDSTWVAAAFANSEVTRWIPFLPDPYEQADAERFVALQTTPKADALAVVLDGKGIGCITILTELGYWFAQPAWGQGFASEAARAITARHFENGQSHLESGYVLGNERSCRVLEKLGFTNREQLVREKAVRGQDVTIQRMAMSRQDWEAHT